MNQEIVVGYDGSGPSRSALAWAVREARRHVLDLAVCHAWNVPYASLEHTVEDAARTFATSILDEGALLARQELPVLRVRPLLVRGPAGPVLARTSNDAAMLVVGTRNAREPGHLQAPSVDGYAASHAQCPVAIVREGALPTEGSVIVALSGAAQSALAFGFEHAAACGANLQVWAAPRSGPADFALEWRWFDDSLARWQEKYPDVPVAADFAETRPLPERLSRVDDVVLIVVSSPARLDEALLSHPSAPVAVVRA